MDSREQARALDDALDARIQSLLRGENNPAPGATSR